MGGGCLFYYQLTLPLILAAAAPQGVYHLGNICADTNIRDSNVAMLTSQHASFINIKGDYNYTCSRSYTIKLNCRADDFYYP